MLSTLCIIPVSAADDEVQVGEAKMTFAEFVSNYSSYASSEVTLLKNVDASALAASLSAFSGTLNGGGCTVSGLSVALFDSLADGATVTDLTLGGAITKDAAGNYGALANTASGAVTVTDCTNNVSITATVEDASYVGGFIGHSNADGTAIAMTRCTNNGSVAVTCTVTASKNIQVGGLLGRIEKGTVALEKCMNTANITANNSNETGVSSGNYIVGGMAGSQRSGIATLSLSNCVNTGSIFGIDYAGGIAGDVQAKSVSVVNCLNFGSIDTFVTNSSNSRPGGLVASTSNVTTFEMTRCINYGDVTVNESSDAKVSCSARAGGLVGSHSATNALFSYCANYGDVVTVTEGGGLFGRNHSGATTVTACLVNASVTLKSDRINTGTESIGMLCGFVNKGSVTPDENTKYVASEGEGSVASEAEWRKTVGGVYYVGTQTTAVKGGKLDARMIAVVPTVSGYTAAGYEIVRSSDSGVGAISMSTDTVYTSLLGTDSEGVTHTYTPEDVGAPASASLMAIAIHGIPATGTVRFTVRPFAVDGNGNTVYSAAVTLTFADGVLQ